MYKVFVSELPVYLGGGEKDDEIDDSVKIIERDGAKNLVEQITEAQNDSAGIWIPGNAEGLFQELRKSFEWVEAAGGLVKDEKGRVLMIYRRGHWDLPKGKMEKGESVEETAIREVEEECSISDLKITKNLDPTYHTYHDKDTGTPMLKKSWLFEMRSHSDQKLFPQVEEEITEVCWMTVPEIRPITDKAYKSIVDVLKDGGVL